MKNYKNDGTVLNSYKYSYDPNSNPASIITDKGTVSYEYDSLNQLTKETLTDGTVITYEYDAVGNRTKKIETKGTTTTTTNYTYNAGNELTNVNGKGYTYDQNGNLMDDGEKTYIYNEENQLIEIKDQLGNSLAKFIYDHEGKRSSATTPTGATNFHYLDDMVIAETDINNNIIAEYSWDTKGNPLTMSKGGKTYYYHLNGHGDVTSLTDENGNVVAEYQYDAWGNIISQSGTMASSNPYRYAGYRYDEATKLYYLMSRYYKPSDGRFITKDSFLGFAEDTASLNLYTYTKNNPIIYIDTDGHFAIPAAYALALAVLGAGLVYYGIQTLKAVGNLVDQSFARVKSRPRYKSKKELHHIVAQNARKAQSARDILRKVNISVNNSENLVSIKTGLHRRLHTNLYYSAVNSILSKAYNKKYSYNTNKNRVIAALRTIKTWLKLKSAASPF